MGIISKYRGELMGVAILLVLWYHIFTGTGSSIIPGLSSIGYFGVDIFLFLSGIGLCYGYGKYKSVVQFYKRRVLRIYPTYLTAIIIGALLTTSFSIVDIIIKSVCVGYFLPVYGMSSFDWYVPTIILFYLIFPILYRLNYNKLMGGGSYTPVSVSICA